MYYIHQWHTESDRKKQRFSLSYVSIFACALLRFASAVISYTLASAHGVRSARASACVRETMLSVVYVCTSDIVRRAWIWIERERDRDERWNLHPNSSSQYISLFAFWKCIECIISEHFALYWVIEKSCVFFRVENERILIKCENELYIVKSECVERTERIPSDSEQILRIPFSVTPSHTTKQTNFRLVPSHNKTVFFFALCTFCCCFPFLLRFVSFSA